MPEEGFPSRARSPRSVALFLVILILPQAYAFARQFRLGFRPLGRAPVRVALSWDMFATDIERCTLTWTPPIETPIGRLSNFRDMEPALEWDVVGDAPQQYEHWGRMGCVYARVPTRVSLKCVRTDGTWEDRGFDCP